MFLGLGKTVDARNVVLDGQGLAKDASVRSLVDLTSVRPGTVSIDLMEGDVHITTGLNLSDGTLSELSLGHLSDINVPRQLGTPAGVDGAGFDFGVADDGRVHLAGADGGAVSRNGVADHEADRWRGPRQPLSGQNHGMGVNQGKQSRQRQGVSGFTEHGE